MGNKEQIICGDLVCNHDNGYGIVVVTFGKCCGVRFKNSNEVKIMMYEGLKKIK